jgi:ATP-dependent Clp endopeptidase proteolytic subunit ClpP
MTKKEIARSNLDSGKIFLYGEINDKAVRIISEKLRYLVFNKKLKTIYVYISSMGGEYEAGCAISDELLGFESIGIKICTIVVGMACSAAADILIMGKERYATSNSVIMMHPIQYNVESDKLSSVRKDTDFTHKHYSAYTELIAKRCGYKTKVKIDEFIEKIEKTLWLTAKEAKKMGIINDIYNYKYEDIDAYNAEENN